MNAQSLNKFGSDYYTNIYIRVLPRFENRWGENG